MPYVNTSKIKALANRFTLIHSLLLPLIVIRRRVKRYKLQRFEKLYNSSFNIVESGVLVVRAVDFRGAFSMDYRSHLTKRLLRDQEYEKALVRLVEKYVDPNKDVLDIGANIGLFTVLFSKLLAANHKVLAVEPTPTAVNHLETNIKTNGCSDSVILFKGVAAAEKGIVELNTISGMEEYSSIGEIVHLAAKDRHYKIIQVDAETIDNLIASYGLNPGFVKIDTEGAEFMVLQGATDMLKNVKPIILSELSDDLLKTVSHTADNVVNLLQDNNYTVINPHAPDVPVQSPYNGEILAIPKTA